MEKIEIRAHEVELSGSEGLKVSGYVNKTDQLSQPLGSVKKFREKIAKGAFTRALRNTKRDIDFLTNHDAQSILASTRNQSLSLVEDDEGLFMSAEITPTSFGKDTFELVKSGILKNMSFGFRSLKDSWQQVGNEMVRTVEELELIEVSVVRDPAYSQSTISARGLDVIEEIEVPAKEQISNKKSEQHKEKRTMMKMESHENDFAAILRGEQRALVKTTDGAALIPENVASEIVKKMEEASSVFARARKLNSVSGSIKVARENDTVQAGFVGEGENILEQALAFQQVELTQKRVGAALTLSNQLINDSAVAVDSYAKDLLARRTAKAVEKSILTGNGGVEFNGIINDADLAQVDVTGSATIDNLLDLYLAIHPSFLQNSVFIMQRDFFQLVAKLKDGNGHFYLQSGVVNGKIGYTLFGLPVEITEALPAATPIVFGNITEAVTVMIKQQQGIQEIVDSQQALRGSKLYVFDAYMDAAVTNPQAVVKLSVS
ncbi:phage major capsid protein [Sporolactobacillus shoreae]|uniref:Phage major capsid protein n=1 Tax=Sporolactobacillus shoreae TaxID=1465501 RepID=A0A4Z0GPG8_9BACL|nr:phage major capsid protein [Sporolactobacillus shoreae]TGA99022.1 phage major capsid protein [Sporolactobacillus shoreae]